MKNPNESPSSAEFGLWRAFMAQARVKQSDLDTHMGDSPGGRTRKEIETGNISMMKDFPKGVKK